MSKFSLLMNYLIHNDILIHRNQKAFPEQIFAAYRGLCQSGGLGKLELITFYAYCDDLGRIESGWYVIK
jgi:hypothetical protein